MTRNQDLLKRFTEILQNLRTAIRAAEDAEHAVTFTHERGKKNRRRLNVTAFEAHGGIQMTREAGRWVPQHVTVMGPEHLFVSDEHPFPEVSKEDLCRAAGLNAKYTVTRDGMEASITAHLGSLDAQVAAYTRYDEVLEQLDLQDPGKLMPWESRYHTRDFVLRISLEEARREIQSVWDLLDMNMAAKN